MHGSLIDRTASPPRIRFLRPDAALGEVVRSYVQREAQLADHELVHPVPARAVPMVEFVFSEPFAIHWCERPLVETTPRAVIIGLQTHRRVRLVIKGTFEAFSIVFQPAGLFRLFSLPLRELTDHDYDATAVIGRSVPDLYERLGACRSFEERARVADGVLLHLLSRRPPMDPISVAANAILRWHGRVRVAALADVTGLSQRQFERRFSAQIGIRPKLYARIARFETALDLKARWAEKSWTGVAHACGYADQMHLIHDFEEFSGETPTGLLTEVERAHRAVIDAVRMGRMPATERDATQLML